MDKLRDRSISKREIANQINILPQPIIHFVTEKDRVDLLDHLRYSTNILLLGERLVLIAGLAVCAVYANRRFFDISDADICDPWLDDHIRTILFLRSYDLGLACAIIQRAGVIRNGTLSSLIQDDRPILEFIIQKPKRTIGRFHQDIQCPLSYRLYELVNYLSFLKEFDFSDNTSEVHFDGKPIQVSPFLRWNGSRLELYQFIKNEKTSRKIVYFYFKEGEKRTESYPIEAQIDEHLRTWANQFKIKNWDSQSPMLEASPQSIMPLFAESYPVLNRLAHKLLEASSPYTKKELWIKPLFHGDEKQQNEALNNDVVLTNAIIHSCLTKDPVTVLTEYFCLEPGDAVEYLRWVLQDTRSADQIMKGIEEEKETYETRLRIIYGPNRESDIKNQTKTFYSKSVATRLVKLLRFPFFELPLFEDILDILGRVQAFNEYLRLAPQNRPDIGKANQALFECIKDVEQVLKSLLLFYSALKYYDPIQPTGISAAKRAELQETFGIFENKGLGRYIGLLNDLNRDPGLSLVLKERLDRTTIMPEDSRKIQFAAVNKLRDFRNKKFAHPGGLLLKYGEIEDIVHQLIGFYQWLLGNTESSSESWRIYPNILGLNVISTNSCGIISLKYRLRDLREGKDVTLYTRQPLSFDCGNYYGLPLGRKSLDDLWVDPVLIAAKEIPC